MAGDKLGLAQEKCSDTGIEGVPKIETKITELSNDEFGEENHKQLQETSGKKYEEEFGENEENEQRNSSSVVDMNYPDGGFRAWLVVLGSFCAMTISFGLSNGTGSIQDYLARERLSSYSESDVGWIFSLWLFFMYMGSVQTGPIFDAYGLRPLLIPGCVGWVASLFILSVCKEYYQFILGFSVLGGISSSMIFNPAITVLGHWFLRKRALATGIAMVGGAVGGIYIPLMLNKLFSQVGYGWSIRVLAFITLGLAIICCLTLESRHVPRKVDWKEALIDVKSLKHPEFGCCTFGVFLVEWAVFVPIIYMVSYAKAQGLGDDYSSQLLCFLNVGSVVGRILPGYIADHYGVYNVMITTASVTGILCLALWIPGGQSKAGLTAFAVLDGVWSGSTISITPVCVGAISDIKDYGKRYGTCYSIAGIAVLTGLPIAGALTKNNYLGMKIFSGVIYLAGAGMFLLARWLAVGKKLKF